MLKEKKELREKIIQVIKEENGALKASEITEKIYGNMDIDLYVKVKVVPNDAKNKEIFANLGDEIGYTLTDDMWDHLEMIGKTCIMSYTKKC